MKHSNIFIYSHRSRSCEIYENFRNFINFINLNDIFCNKRDIHDLLENSKYSMLCWEIVDNMNKEFMNVYLE